MRPSDVRIREACGQLDQLRAAPLSQATDESLRGALRGTPLSPQQWGAVYAAFPKEFPEALRTLNAQNQQPAPRPPANETTEQRVARQMERLGPGMRENFLREQAIAQMSPEQARDVAGRISEWSRSPAGRPQGWQTPPSSPEGGANAFRNPYFTVSLTPQQVANSVTGFQIAGENVPACDLSRLTPSPAPAGSSGSRTTPQPPRR